MSTIAAIVGDMFEDAEYTEPVKAFKAAGHVVRNIGVRKGETVEGKKHTASVTIDEAAGDASPEEFDALFIPGGHSPDNLRAHDEAVDFVKEFVQTDKPILAICHGPQLLITAQVLRGRKITGYKSIRQDIINAGAEFVDREVVEVGNIISSRNPRDIPAFVNASLKRLAA